MRNITCLEKEVYNALLDICFDEYSASAADISNAISVDVNRVKGALGSLTKKSMVDSDEETRGGQSFNDAWPIVDGDAISFGCDNYNDDDYKEFYVK